MAIEMKDSGIAWIGEIPNGWNCYPLKAILLQNDGGVWGNDPSGDDDKIVLRSTEQTVDGKWSIINPALRDLHSVSDLKYYQIKTGDLLITKSSGSALHIGKTSIADERIESMACYYSNFIQRIRVNQNGFPKYYWYVLNSIIAREQFVFMQNTTSGIGNLNATYIGNIVIPIPPIDEQSHIATLLDRKCAEIDSVIASTQRTIEEYKQFKQSIVTEAVTKGVRGKRSMKDSGINWVKQIPEEWNSISPKALFTQRKDKASAGEKQLTASQQYGVIYQEDYMSITGSKIVTVEKDFDILKHVEAGDFVISMRSFQGGLEYSTLSGSISSAYVMLIPNTEKVFPRFFRWLLKSPAYINALQSTSNMVRDGQAMRYSNFAQVRLYTVPMDEQEEIADYLDAKCASFDELISAKEQLLIELESYKKSVIFEFITGKKEVPQCSQQ